MADKSRSKASRSRDTAAAEAGGSAAAAGPPRGRPEPGAHDPYADAVSTIFAHDAAVRDALSVQLGERGADAAELVARGHEAFAQFTPSRFSDDDRSRATYLAPGDDLETVLGGVVRRGLARRREAPAGRLRLRLTDRVLDRIEPARPREGTIESGGSDGPLGRIALADVLDLATGPAEPRPRTPPDAPCRAEREADRLLDEALGVPEPTAVDATVEPADGAGDRHRATSNGRGPAGHADPRVSDKVDDLLAPMSAPERPVRFSVGSTPGHGEVGADIQTFELRSGPSDVTAYHDFASLRIAFEDVWTEVFDGRLSEAGRRLYQECVRLKDVLGLDTDTAPVSTLSDLRRLMDEVRELGDVALDLTPGEVRPGAAVAVHGVTQATAAADAVKVALDPLGAAVEGVGGSTLRDVLDPGGAALRGLARVLAGKAHLTWDSFAGTLPSGDVISLGLDAGAIPEGFVEIVIAAGPQADWWKGIRFQEFDQRNEPVLERRISTDPDDSDVSDPASHDRVRLETSRMRRGVLEFSKAAFLGVHTGFYVLYDLPRMLADGNRVTFTWVKAS